MHQTSRHACANAHAREGHLARRSSRTIYLEAGDVGGKYIYVADRAGGVEAYTFDGNTFTLAGIFNTTDQVKDVWGDGTYIYAADSVNGIKALKATPCACSSPTGAEGTIIYNSSNTVMRYCDGANWRGIGK